MRHPRLNLGLLGFTAEQRQHLQNGIDACEAAASGNLPAEDADALATQPIWQLTDFREANALLLNTDNAQMDADKTVRFHVDPEYPGVVGVQPSELTVPYAVCGKLAKKIQNDSFGHIPTVVWHDERSVHQCQLHFEAALRPLRTLYSLAYELLERRAELDNKHTFHLMRNSTLDAIVDVPQRRVLVRDGLRPIDLDDVVWQSRPAAANTRPSGFSVWMMEEVMWVHALHCHHFSLPKRYYHMPLYLRRTPRVRASMVYPRHAALLEILAQEAITYDRLVELYMELHPDRLAQTERDIYALYACHAITTNANGVSSWDSLNSSNSSQPPQAANPSEEAERAGFHLQTAPAYLL
jgi:hypothetical protein